MSLSRSNAFQYRGVASVSGEECLQGGERYPLIERQRVEHTAGAWYATEKVSLTISMKASECVNHCSRSFVIGLGMLFFLSIIVHVFTYVGLSAAAREQQTASAQQIKTDSVQAVFLTNGQVYFGHIRQADPLTITLEDVFYLQADQELQSGEAVDGASSSGSLSLVKLGSAEVHGPEDTMIINREQVLFWENLEEDSQVSQAIAEYDAQGVILEGDSQDGADAGAAEDGSGNANSDNAE